VRALQRLLTHSYSGKVVAVRRVTENTGKKTPGVDQEIWDTPEKKIQAVQALKRRGYQPQPLRRVYIPKSDGKTMRPLGIPTMKDRAQQALYLLALDPVVETTVDKNSYGFRPQRSCADAIAQCFFALKSAKTAFRLSVPCPRWVAPDRATLRDSSSAVSSQSGADFSPGRVGLLQLLNASLPWCCCYHPARVFHLISQFCVGPYCLRSTTVSSASGAWPFGVTYAFTFVTAQ
jgi:hypothetical protein